MRRRWMCNVCRKLHITHTASLAHAATHTDCSFIPKPVLVDVLVSKKAFSDPIQVVSALTTPTCAPQVDNELNDGVSCSIERVIRTHGVKQFDNASLLSARSVPGHDRKDFTDISYSYPKPRSYVEQTPPNGKMPNDVQRVPYLSDNVAYNISKTNNLQWRNHGSPYQSIDQKSALERTIEKLYSRQQSNTEPRVHEILIKKRLTMKHVKSSPTRILRKPVSLEDNSSDNSNHVPKSESCTSVKRKNVEDEINTTGKVQKLQDGEYVVQYINVHTELQPSTSLYRVNKESISNFTNPINTAESTKMVTHPLPVLPYINTDDNVASCSKSSDDVAPSTSTNNGNSTNVKVWTLFHDDWDDDVNVEISQPTSTLTETEQLLTYVNVGNDTPEPSNSRFCTKTLTESQSLCIPISSARIEPQPSNSRFSTKSSKDQILDEWSNTSDSHHSSPLPSQEVFDSVPNPEGPHMRLIELSSDSNGSSVVSIEDDTNSTLHMSKVPRNARLTTTHTSEKCNISNIPVISPVDVSIPVRSTKPNRVLNKPFDTELSRSIPAPDKFKPNFSQFTEKRASSVILDRRRFDSDKPSVARNCENNHSGSNRLPSNYAATSVSSAVHSALGTAGNHITVPSNCNIEVLEQQEGSAAGSDAMRLFDCGSAAEEPLDDPADLSLAARTGPLRVASPLPALFSDADEQHPAQDDEDYPESPDTADDDGSAADSKKSDDKTIMKAATNLGLFDTGFEECCLHEVEVDEQTPCSSKSTHNLT